MLMTRSGTSLSPNQEGLRLGKISRHDNPRQDQFDHLIEDSGIGMTKELQMGDVQLYLSKYPIIQDSEKTAEVPHVLSSGKVVHVPIVMQRQVRTIKLCSHGRSSDGPLVPAVQRCRKLLEVPRVPFSD